MKVIQGTYLNAILTNTMKENNDLFKEYSKNKNISLRNKIVLNNINLVPYTINHYNLFIDGVHDYEEMLQDGYIALIKAVESFDYSLGFKFSSYAIKCILSLTRTRLDYNKDVSLNTPINEGAETEIEIIDTIEDESIDIEKDIINENFYREIKKNLSFNLNDIELEVIKAIYGIDQEVKSYKDLSCILKLDINYLKKIKKQAENKVRKSSYFKKLYKERNPISYYPKMIFDNDKSSPTNQINSPVERIVLEKQKQEKQLLKKTLKHIKSTF